ncbi:MAG: nucleotidyltransferase [Spirochaetae bacterium HGW-Spirochaetae-6]|nr:MAG: nucleotidyltransferase [Spirochaetae bacterium HGW-Spirochaetae-6]
MPKLLQDMIHQLRKEKTDLMNKYHIRSLGIFGFYIKNQANENSDLDILVDFEQTPDLFSFLDLEERLSEIVQTKVDLVSSKALKPHIGKQILSEVQYL